jgi:hypothetical protein
MKAQIKDIIDINTKCAEFWGVQVVGLQLKLLTYYQSLA